MMQLRTTKIVLLALMAVFLFNVSFQSLGQGALSMKAPAAYAEEPSANANADDGLKLDDVAKEIFRASTLINKIFNPMIHFLVFQIGNFLGNDYIYGGDMGQMLKGIWVLNRNIVNIIFAILLLVIAFMSIFPSEGGESKFAVKKLMTPFILMLIAVNFSWLGGKVILDASNVVTNVIFQIPSGVKPVQETIMNIAEEQCDVTDPQNIKGLCVPSKIYFPFDATEDLNFNDNNCPDASIIAAVNSKPPTAPKREQDQYGKKHIFCWETMDFAKYNQNNASIFLSHGIVKVQRLGKVNEAAGASKLFVGTLAALAIQIVYMAAFLVLWIVLLVRVAVLWFVVAFSPFIVLGFFLEKIGGKLPEQFSLTHFLEYAFVPAKAGAVITVGFVMVAAGQGSADLIFESKAGGITTEMFEIGSLFPGMATLQQFIWLLMVVLIVWVGIFKAIEGASIVTHVTNHIKGLGDKFGSWVGESAKWVPLVPLNTDKDGRKQFLTAGGHVADMDKIKQQFAHGTDAGAYKFRKGHEVLMNDPKLREQWYAMANTPAHLNDKKLLLDIKGKLKVTDDDIKNNVSRFEDMLTGSGYQPAQVRVISDSVQRALGMTGGGHDEHGGGGAGGHPGESKPTPAGGAAASAPVNAPAPSTP